jgi:hypothetical protein
MDAGTFAETVTSFLMNSIEGLASVPGATIASVVNGVTTSATTAISTSAQNFPINYDFEKLCQAGINFISEAVTVASVNSNATPASLVQAATYANNYLMAAANSYNEAGLAAAMAVSDAVASGNMNQHDHVTVANNAAAIAITNCVGQYNYINLPTPSLAVILSMNTFIKYLSMSAGEGALAVVKATTAAATKATATTASFW